MKYLTADKGFLEPGRPDAAAPDAARVVVIPFGLEASVSYGGGTARGPQALLRASHQLELYDEEFDYEPCTRFGIATLAAPEPPAGIEAALGVLSSLVEDVCASDRFPLVIGGEHSVTPGALRPLAARHPELVILQIDAHADLRDGYLGEHFSHASAMRRCLDYPGVSVVSVGIRSISRAEADFAQANGDRVALHFAKDQHTWSLDDIVAPIAGRPLYITFDIDGLDSALMPATGTPTPGGVDYWTALAIMRRASEVASVVVGGDVVELAPIEGLHACDYTAAAVAYKLMTYALCAR
ncbi:MAG: agmatinase [Hyphomicrobiaceae bacterium]